MLLLERGHLPRHKVCGEFVSAESLGLLRELLGRAGAATLLEPAPRISEVRIWVDDARLRSSIRPAAASIPRSDLDHALWLAAEEAGASCRQRTAVEDIIGRGPFRLSTADGLFDAQAVVDASGRNSNLRHSRTEAARQRWIGLKAHCRTEEAVEECVDLYFFEDGYCGVQPVAAGLLNVCAMVREGGAHDLTDVFPRSRHLQARSRRWRQAIDTVRTFPLTFRRPLPIRLRVLHAGDAAGFVDPFVGDGIAIALRTGAMAARALSPFLAGEGTLDDAASRYRSEYESAIAPVFRNASLLRRLSDLPGPVRRSILRVLQIPALGRLLVHKTRSRTTT